MYFKHIPLFNSYKSLHCIFSCPQDGLCNLWGPVKNENVGDSVYKAEEKMPWKAIKYKAIPFFCGLLLSLNVAVCLISYLMLFKVKQN